MTKQAWARGLLRTPSRMLATFGILSLLVVLLPVLLVASGRPFVALVVLVGGLALAGMLASALLPARRRD